jgi:hypothetical protein
MFLTIKIQHNTVDYLLIVHLKGESTALIPPTWRYNNNNIRSLKHTKSIIFCLRSIGVSEFMDLDYICVVCGSELNLHLGCSLQQYD